MFSALLDRKSHQTFPGIWAGYEDTVYGRSTQYAHSLTSDSLISLIAFCDGKSNLRLTGSFALNGIKTRQLLKKMVK